MTEPDESKTQRPRVQSAARAVAILTTVAQSENGLTAKALGEKLHLGRQTVYHLLHTLIETKMLIRVDDKVLLGLGVGTLVHGFEHQLTPAERLAPMVREVAQRTEDTVYAAGWRHGEVTVHTVTQGRSPVQIAVPQGFSGFAHARASGKLLLAVATPAVRKEYLDTHDLEAVTGHTITDRFALDRELEHIRDVGYAIDRQEFAEGVCCVAMPMDRGPAPFVLAVSSPRDRFEDQLDNYLDVLSKVTQSSDVLLPTDDSAP